MISKTAGNMEELGNKGLGLSCRNLIRTKTSGVRFPFCSRGARRLSALLHLQACSSKGAFWCLQIPFALRVCSLAMS